MTVATNIPALKASRFSGLGYILIILLGVLRVNFLESGIIMVVVLSPALLVILKPIDKILLYPLCFKDSDKQ